MAGRPTIVLDNRFDVPPAFAAQWLTDFRPDDGPKWFDRPSQGTVRREGNRVYREEPFATNMLNKGYVDLESPTRWTGATDTYRDGKLMMRSRLVETVAPVGGGTHHHVEIFWEPATLMARLMMPLMAGKVRRDLVQGFGRMKQEMEQAAREGRPPTS